MTYDELEAVFRRHMYFSRDPDELLMVASIILAQKLDSIPLWLFLIAKSGGGKSSILEATVGSDKVYVTDGITSKSLVSAYRGDEGIDPVNSLMSKIDGKTLIIPDFMSIIEADPRERREVFGQLRQAFSGRLQRDTGLGSVSASARFNIIAAGTKAIDKFRETETSMGERFVVYRSRQLETNNLGRLILASSSDDLMALDLVVSMNTFLAENEIRPDVPTLPHEVGTLILRWASMLVRLRNTVMWNQYTRQIDYPVDASESYTRVLKQLKTLAYALIMTSGNVQRSLQVLAKVAIDCIPWPRMKLLQGIRKGVADRDTLRRVHVTCGRYAFEKIIAEMDVLGVIHRLPAQRGDRSSVPVITTEFNDFFDEIAALIDTPEELGR